MKLSVALCTYNGSKFIEQQINSILNQTTKVDEIIVCDDKSTDATVSILKEIQVANPCIVIIENEINLRSTKNFEKAIQLCSGDYIFLADQDDLWNTEKVAKTLAIFNENLTAEGVFTNADLIDDNGTKLSNKTIWDSVFFFEKEMQKPIDFVDIIFKNGNIVTGATLCIKKEVKSFIFPFSKDNLHDEWIASLLAFKNTLYYSSENLISYRIHDNQQIGMKNLDKMEKITRKKRVILGLDIPNSFSEYRFLLKKIFLKKKEIVNFQKYNFDFIDFQKLQSENNIEWELISEKTKSAFPIRYKITSLIDAILGKRTL
ncbi:glycosyltransferase [Flavobacterium sp.]|uniref:glycosyltransferase n=1 Tax=Flavobacterium sp. TaxID=239 RepID=UPI003340DAD3